MLYSLTCLVLVVISLCCQCSKPHYVVMCYPININGFPITHDLT